MMDKAKAYDEALKRARKMLNMILDNELLGFPDQIREIFPQLRESNDERIREELIEYHKQQFENNRDQEVGLFHKDAIAYLEKQKEPENTSAFTMAPSCWEVEQKEQKPIEPECPQFVFDDILALECAMGIVYRKGDEQKLYEALMSLHSRLHDMIDAQKEQESTPNTYGCLNCTKLEECKKGLTPCSGHRLKIVDQKPADDKAFEEWIDSWFKEHKEKAYPQITMDEKEFKNFCRGIRNMYQQKSDWSEEDKRMFSRCIKSIECSKKFADSETYKAAKDVEINWLKDIYLSLKKHNEAVEKLCSNEWTEEDEAAYDAFICEVVNEKMNPTIEQVKWFRGIRDRLKSLRPSWKPSEEQIHAIIEALKYLPNNKDEWMVLNTLVDVFKKLI